jgi:heavy metal sensor kinase
MAVVLAAMGFFVYVRVGNALLTSVDQSLRAGAQETAAHLRREEDGGDVALVDPDAARGETLAQLLTPGGRVIRSTPPGLAPLLAGKVTAGLQTTGLPGRKHDWRVLTAPVTTAGGAAVLVIATSLAARQETLHHLLKELVVGGVFVLLLASLAGYALAVGTLRPVELMRRRAAAISASTPGRRLPVPRAHDEIARLAETLNDMLGRLEGALEHERRFVADASHELRTPLALLRTELEVALRRPRSREELEAALRSASEETERLTRLAEDLLLIARSDQGGVPVRLEQVEAGELLRGTAARFSARAAERDRRIEVDDAELTLAADPVRLEQALGNLVENALRHGRGAIELSAREADETVELHVTDEGDGFPDGFVERAFDRFSRADEARSHGGTGLGLSIVQLIAAAHGGVAGARNRANGGADVWIAVPRFMRDSSPAAPLVAWSGTPEPASTPATRGSAG